MSTPALVERIRPAREQRPVQVVGNDDRLEALTARTARACRSRGRPARTCTPANRPAARGRRRRLRRPRAAKKRAWRPAPPRRRAPGRGRPAAPSARPTARRLPPAAKVSAARRAGSRSLPVVGGLRRKPCARYPRPAGDGGQHLVDAELGGPRSASRRLVSRAPQADRDLHVGNWRRRRRAR